MVVLSCFDGMSCGQIAFERAGINVKKYYASEIDKYAIKVTQSNYPDTIQLGSITEWQSWNIEKPDIIIGGSPCQGFSFAGKGLNFEDERSKLFFTFVDILKHFKPKYFLLENVIMKKEHNDVISSILGEIYPECVEQTELFRTGRLEPIEINSSLVSAQNRRRLYWTNIPGIKQPEDKGILLKDIIENATADKDKSYCLDANYWEGCSKEYSDLKGRRQLVSEIINHNSKDGLKCVAGINKNKKWLGDGKNLQRNFSQGERIYSVEGKSPTISAQSGGTAGPGNFLITGGAFRGRNPENPSVIGKVGNQNKWKNYGDKSPTLRGLSRTNNIPKTEQRLEINETGKSNALTGVQKDNIIVVGHADIKGHDIIKRVYSPDGKAPTLTHIQGGNQEPKIEIELSDKSQTILSTLYKENLKSMKDRNKDGLHIGWRKLTPLECERLQTVPDNYTKYLDIRQYNMYIRQEIKNGRIKCLKKYVKLKDVKTKSEHINMGNSVFCITKDLLDTEVLICLKKNLNQKKNVNIVIEKSEKKEVVQEECAINITKIGEDMETLCFQIKNILNLENMGIIKQINIKLPTIGKYMKITLEENSKEMKLFTILISLKLIMILEIYTIVKQEANIHFCIDNLKILQENYIELELSDLKMENITLNSNSQRYKMLGNGWTVDVISHIFKNIN